MSGEPVDTADRVKGYQFSKGQYVMVEDADLEALKLESTKTIELETFVPQSEVDEIYLDSPYYLAPDDKVAEEAFAVIRDAMMKKKVAGIGRVVLSRRERLLMLHPRGKGMMATTLRYPYEVRQDSEYFSDIHDVKLSDEMLDIAQEIIARKAGHFEPDKFTDRYEEALVEMLRAKQSGQVFTAPETAEPGNVVNIMDALRKSLQASGGERVPPAGRARSARRPPRRRPRPPNRRPARRLRAKPRAKGGRPGCLSPDKPSTSSAASRV